MEFSTCIFCAQAIYTETLPSGREAFVADDGWGTICADSPSDEHEPVACAASFVPAVLDAARP